MQTLSLQSVILDSIGELTQFKDGINSLGVGEAIDNFQAIMRSFYCTDSKTKIGAGIYMCMYMYMINNISLEGDNVNFMIWEHTPCWIFQILEVDFSERYSSLIWGNWQAWWVYCT